MCGRYVLALRMWQIRNMLQDNDMPVWDVPDNEGEGEGEGGVVPRQSYNFAPGYNGVVYRADVPDYGAGPRRKRSSKKAAASSSQEPWDEEAAASSQPAADESEASAQQQEVHYKLQPMKWGLVPFWTKRNPDYATVLKTINCRDDSLAASGGMWASMKGRKRCIVICQGFYEWLKTGPNNKERVPHYIRRKDGQLMCFAGLWDCVKYEDDPAAATEEGKEPRKNYTYTIVTTDSNAQLKFLHDRMPVILDPGSEKLWTWLDPSRYEWSKELQHLLKPWDGELEIDVVSKEVNKVGNNSPTFIIPVASKENKSNIANFFANAKAKQDGAKLKSKPEAEVKKEPASSPVKMEVEPAGEVAGDDGMRLRSSIKREADETLATPPKKKPASTKPAPSPSPSKPAARSKFSATSNGTKSPSKSKSAGTQKITKFFGSAT